jgi:hypothetical protein
VLVFNRDTNTWILTIKLRESWLMLSERPCVSASFAVSLSCAGGACRGGAIDFGETGTELVLLRGD